MLQILFYWFPAQEQTSIARLKKFDFLYLKFSIELHKLNVNFWNQQKKNKKWLEPK